MLKNLLMHDKFIYPLPLTGHKLHDSPSEEEFKNDRANGMQLVMQDGIVAKFKVLRWHNGKTYASDFEIVSSTKIKSSEINRIQRMIDVRLRKFLNKNQINLP